MSNNMSVSPFDPPANAAQMAKLKRLSVHTTYWKLMTAAAYRAMREVVGELMAAQALDPDALPLLQSLIGVCSPWIPTVSPVARPGGFKITEMPEPFGRTEADGEWVKRVREDQVAPSFPGWFVLAATSVQQRGFREEQWIAEQWWGPGEQRTQGSLDEVLHGLPLTVISDGTGHRQRSAMGALLRPMAALGGFQEKPLLFCSVVAKKLGLAADPVDAFRYLDREGNALVTTIQWREGGIHARESDTSYHGFGSVVLVASSLKKALLPFLPVTFTLTS